MTHAAIFTGYNMSGWFVFGETLAMTRCAVIHDASMTKRCWYKTCGLVAVTAVSIGWYMV